MNCDDCHEYLYAFLDRELAPDEQTQVREPLDACPPCRQYFAFEANVLRRVGDCGRRVTAPPDLVERVRVLCDQEVRRRASG